MYRAWSYFLGASSLAILHFLVIPSALIRRHWTQESFLKRLCQLVLKGHGIRVVEIGRPERLPEQAVYISNHSSTLDIFVYCALGIPRCRFFLTGDEWPIAPVYLPAWALKTFFTVSQKKTEERRKIFAAAAENLRRTGDSVLLTPEGKRVIGNPIAPFNKGAFHLAISVGVPIVPIYVDIERHIDPGVGFRTEPGTIRVVWGEPIRDLPGEFDGSREIPDRARSWYLELRKKLASEAEALGADNPFRRASEKLS